jgi:hypothetical protein
MSHAFQPPKIDQRTYDDIVRQIAEIVSAADIKVMEKPKDGTPPSGNQKPDPGYGIDSHF